VVAKHLIDQLARAAKTGDQSAWQPRPPSMSFYQGTVSRVDNFNGIVDWVANDPSGLVLPNVRVLQAYSPASRPGVGHVAVGVHVGTDFYILGQHVVPNSIVIP